MGPSPKATHIMTPQDVNADVCRYSLADDDEFKEWRAYNIKGER